MSEEDYAQIKKKFSVEREEAVEKERKKYEGDLKFELGELKQQVRVSSIAYSVSCRGGVCKELNLSSRVWTRRQTFGTAATLRRRQGQQTVAII